MEDFYLLYKVLSISKNHKLVNKPLYKYNYFLKRKPMEQIIKDNELDKYLPKEVLNDKGFINIMLLE